MPIEVTYPQAETMPDLTEFMTTEEAAGRLGYNVIYIRQMLRDNKLDGVKFGRVWFVSRESVKVYLGQTSGMDKNDPRRGQSG